MSKAAVALAKRADSRIRLLRGQKIILDSDLAELYGVPSKRLNQQVTRNVHRFPADFRFRLSRSEFENLGCNLQPQSWRKGARAYLPYASTDTGASMPPPLLNPNG